MRAGNIGRFTGEAVSEPTLNQIAGLLPGRPPRVREFVEVRSRRWLVESVETPAPPAFPRVGLACADDDAQGRTLEVWWDFEIDRRTRISEGVAKRSRLLTSNLECTLPDDTS